MHRLAALVLFALLACTCACSDPTTLTACGVPCYTGPDGTQGRGLCTPGITVCTSSGAISCVDQVLPTPEDCDGLDQNCNGYADEGLNVNTSTCGSNIGECRRGTWICSTAGWFCSGEQRPVDEVFDCKDNNCDGLIDEDLGIKFCYDGPDEAVLYGQCRPGILQCDDTCRDQVLPEPLDICGNGIDDDCDGAVDENEVADNTIPVDILFIIDQSCSMGPHQPQVKATLQSFAASRRDDTRYRFWIVDLPDRSPMSVAAFNPDCHPTINPAYACPTDDFLAAVADFRTNRNRGEEVSYDALLDIYDGTLRVDWTPGANRFIVILADEPGQTIYPGSVTETSVAAAAAAFGAPVYVFTRTEGVQNSYDEITARSGGGLYDLTQTATELGRIFDLIFVEPCEE